MEWSIDRTGNNTGPYSQVTKHIRVRSGSGGGGSAQDLASFTPTFLWLLRDFYLGVFCSPLSSYLAIEPTSMEGMDRTEVHSVCPPPD